MFCKYCGKAGGSFHGVCSICGKNGFDYDQNGYVNCCDLYDYLIDAGVKNLAYDKENRQSADYFKEDRNPDKKAVFIHEEPELNLDDNYCDDFYCENDMQKESSGKNWKVWILLIILCIAVALSVICFFIMRSNSGKENEKTPPVTETSVSTVTTGTEISVTQFQFVEGSTVPNETTVFNTSLPESETTVYTDTTTSSGTYAAGAYKAKTTSPPVNSDTSVNSDTVVTTTTTSAPIAAATNAISENAESSENANEKESNENE